MRIGILLLIVALLAGCATRPESGASSSHYRGVYAPGSAKIAEDGKFVSTGSVLKAEQRDIAGEAALMRLVTAAREKGLSHVVVAKVNTDEGSGLGYRIEGRLYHAEDAPPNAVALDEIEATLLQHLSYVPERPVAQPVRQPSFAVPAEKPSEDPLVIKAPDFVS